VRSQSDEVHQKLFDGIRRTANAVAAMAGAQPPEIALSSGVKSVMNDQALMASTAAVFSTAFGSKARPMPAPWSGGEDYTDFIVAGVPSVFFGLGVYDPARMAAAKVKGIPVPANHSPFFAPVPEPTIRTGVMAMSLAVMNAMPIN
jgi:hippurate hydrolase